MAKKIDIEAAPAGTGAPYPAPFHTPCAGRFARRLGDAAGLTQIGVNLTRLPPGGWSSQRHWHTAQDEFIFVVAGEAVLVSDAGEEIFRAGDSVGFKAGTADGHHFQNRSQADVLLLEMGARRPGEDEAFYPDIDLHRGLAGYARRTGEPYPPRPPTGPAGGTR